MLETEILGMSAKEALRYVNDWSAVGFMAAIGIGLVWGTIRSQFKKDDKPSKPKWGR